MKDVMTTNFKALDEAGKKTIIAVYKFSHMIEVELTAVVNSKRK